MDFNELNDILKQYLRFNNYESTLQALQAEQRSKCASDLRSGVKKRQLNIVPKDRASLQNFPRLYKFYEKDFIKTIKEESLERDLHEVQKKSGTSMQAARQIFSIAINCLQQLHNVKDQVSERGQSGTGNSMTDNLSETLENYKIQLGKYKKFLFQEGEHDKSQFFIQAVMSEHKTKLIKASDEQNLEHIIEVLLSLRVNALQISPDLRKNLVYQLIRNDMFQIEQKKNNNFVLDLLFIQSNALKHALCALISVLASTLKGVEYLTQIDMGIVKRIIEILKDQEDGSVTQRFCIAILQKMSVKEDTIKPMVKDQIIEWILSLLQKAKSTEIHTFALDFASALLANIFHAGYTLDLLESQGSFTKKIFDKLLNLIKQSNIPTSVLMHILICLCYLGKERFAKQIEECMFSDKIMEFVEYYSTLSMGDENGQIDKKTVLDLCAHMFHPKDASHQARQQHIYALNLISQTMEYNDMKCEDKIRQFENQQGDLIFECFQDEVSQ